jgi:hypothetical protein
MGSIGINTDRLSGFKEGHQAFPEVVLMWTIPQYALRIFFDGNAVQVELKGGLYRWMYMLVFGEIGDAKKRMLRFGQLQRFMIVSDTVDPDQYGFFL